MTQLGPINTRELYDYRWLCPQNPLVIMLPMAKQMPYMAMGSRWSHRDEHDELCAKISSFSHPTIHCCCFTQQWLVNVPSFMVFPGRSYQGSLGIHHGNQCSIYFYHVLSMISYDSHGQEVFPYRKGNIFHYIPQCPNLFWGCPGKPG